MEQGGKMKTANALLTATGATPARSIPIAWFLSACDKRGILSKGVLCFGVYTE
jgi:hypothetical protein